MAKTVPFLINPPKKKGRKRAKKKVLRPLATKVKGRWRTSLKARIVKPGIFLNPSLAIVGGNPMKKNARRKRRYSRRRKNPMAAFKKTNPRRRSRRRSYRRRRNPVTVRGMMGKFQSTLPLAVTGVAAGVVVNMVPGFLGLTNIWANLGLKAATAIVGGPMIGQMVGRSHGDVWTIVGLSVLVQDLIKQFMPGVVPGLGYPDYHDALTYGNAGVAAYPEEVGAYPEEVGQVDQPWPYDGGHAYGF